jgi:hypothetical protein
MKIPRQFNLELRDQTLKIRAEHITINQTNVIAHEHESFQHGKKGDQPSRNSASRANKNLLITSCCSSNHLD